MWARNDLCVGFPEITDTSITHLEITLYAADVHQSIDTEGT